METVDCDYCKNDDTILWAERFGVKVVKCKKCGLIYSNPRYTHEELSEFYKSEYFKQGGNYTEDTMRMKQYKIDIADFEKVCGTSGRVLDVGCAIGLFLSMLPKTWEKYGIDDSEEATKLGSEKYGLNLLSGDLPSVDFYDNNYFDVIIMRGTLEHVPSPHAYIKKVYHLLKPGGIFVISTLPNVDSIAAKIYRNKFRLLLPRQHLYHFTPQTVKNYLDLFQFEILRYYYPYLGTPYASPVKDFFNLFFNKLMGKDFSFF